MKLMAKLYPQTTLLCLILTDINGVEHTNSTEMDRSIQRWPLGLKMLQVILYELLSIIFVFLFVNIARTIKYFTQLLVPMWSFKTVFYPHTSSCHSFPFLNFPPLVTCLPYLRRHNHSDVCSHSAHSIIFPSHSEASSALTLTFHIAARTTWQHMVQGYYMHIF